MFSSTNAARLYGVDLGDKVGVTHRDRPLAASGRSRPAGY